MLNSHRHPETHSCLKSIASGTLHRTEQKTIPVYGLSLSKQSFQARHKKLPADPYKFEQYQKMESLKMRQRASPGDPKNKSAFVAPDQRLHLRISIDGVERVFWFRKVGLAINPVTSNHHSLVDVGNRKGTWSSFCSAQGGVIWYTSTFHTVLQVKAHLSPGKATL